MLARAARGAAWAARCRRRRLARDARGRAAAAALGARLARRGGRLRPREPGCARLPACRARAPKTRVWTVRARADGQAARGLGARGTLRPRRGAQRRALEARLAALPRAREPPRGRGRRPARAPTSAAAAHVRVVGSRAARRRSRRAPSGAARRRSRRDPSSESPAREARARTRSSPRRPRSCVVMSYRDRASARARARSRRCSRLTRSGGIVNEVVLPELVAAVAPPVDFDGVADDAAAAGDGGAAAAGGGRRRRGRRARRRPARASALRPRPRRARRARADNDLPPLRHGSRRARDGRGHDARRRRRRRRAPRWSRCTARGARTAGAGSSAAAAARARQAATSAVGRAPLCAPIYVHRRQGVRRRRRVVRVATRPADGGAPPLPRG